MNLDGSGFEIWRPQLCLATSAVVLDESLKTHWLALHEAMLDETVELINAILIPSSQLTII